MVAAMTALLRRPRERRRNLRLLPINGPDAVCEAHFVRIDGIEQWVTVRGHDRANPPLLLLHGGPGAPFTPFNPRLRPWEEAFTVVQWDQRGGGRTFIRSGGADAPSLDRLVADGIELAELIRTRFDQRILLVGSSLGSLLGAIIARRRPDLFSAFVATNLFAAEGAAECWRATRAHAVESGDSRTVADLDALGPDPHRWTPSEAESINKRAIMATPEVPNMVYDLILPALMYDPTLSLSDIQAINRGMRSSLAALQPEYSRFDFDALGWTYDIPYVVVQGTADLVSPLAAARRHWDRVTAPDKAFIPIDGAGHLVEFTDVPRFGAELERVAARAERGSRRPAVEPEPGHTLNRNSTTSPSAIT
jgi:pimeloyl-ACP methyl ester carboxylesterase